MAQICVKLANSAQNLCTPTGSGACQFLPENRVLIHDPSCSSGSFVVTDSGPEISVERIQDMSTVFGLALIALAGVWGIKQLINIFSRDIER